MSTRLTRTLVLAAAVAQSVGAAGDARLVTELPVASTTRIASSEYREASALAARGGSALDVALKIAGRFEGSVQQITQVNEPGDSPAVTRVTVVRDGLLDDSVRSERWEISLERTGQGVWRIREVMRAWRCWRGETRERLSVEPCR